MEYFKAYKMSGRNAAKEVLDMMEELDTTGLSIKEEDVAEISVDLNGKYRVNGSWNRTFSDPAVRIDAHTPLRRFLGLIFAPGSAFAHVSIDRPKYGLIQPMDSIDFNDPILEDFAAAMHRDCSALVIMGDATVIDAFDEILIEYNKEMFTLKLSQKIEAFLREEANKG